MFVYWQGQRVDYFSYYIPESDLRNSEKMIADLEQSWNEQLEKWGEADKVKMSGKTIYDKG